MNKRIIATAALAVAAGVTAYFLTVRRQQAAKAVEPLRASSSAPSLGVVPQDVAGWDAWLRE